jgi:hypothetical protein
MHYFDRIITEIKKEKIVSNSVDLAQIKKQPHDNTIPLKNGNIFKAEKFGQNEGNKNFIKRLYQRKDETPDRHISQKKSSEMFMNNTKNIFKKDFKKENVFSNFFFSLFVLLITCY